MVALKHLSLTELEEGMEHIRQAPKDNGELKMIVRRPRVDEREILNEAELSTSEGLIGDTWKIRFSRHTPDGAANLNAQLTVMNVRMVELLAQDEEHQSMAGDQLYVDFDLSDDNLPAGSRLAIGEALVEVSTQPHTGCSKFSARFGVEALKFVNSPEGKRLHLRGINTQIVRGGTVRVGDVVRKV